MALFHPTYFSSIAQFSLLLHVENLQFEIFDNFQKQTYRNRCYIYGANGKQLLNVPIQKVSGKQLSKDVKIDYNSNWQSEHLKTLFSAYNSSPFFEYYIDELMPLFQKKETFLVDLNLNCLEVIIELLQEKISFTKTIIYQKELPNDYRCLVGAKGQFLYKPTNYTQVFEEKHGFIPNLSILDLLFMEGPATALYLEKNTYF